MTRRTRRRVSYGGRLPQARFGWPWGGFKLYYFRNFSARADADGGRVRTSHGYHFSLPMALPLGLLAVVVGLFFIGGPFALIVGILALLFGWRRLGKLVITKNWTSGVLTVNPPGWGSFRILPKREERP